MTIASEITRIKTNIADTYTALSDKGATLPDALNSDNLATTVATVTTGGGSSTSITSPFSTRFNQKAHDNLVKLMNTIAEEDLTSQVIFEVQNLAEAQAKGMYYIDNYITGSDGTIQHAIANGSGTGKSKITGAIGFVVSSDIDSIYVGYEVTYPLNSYLPAFRIPSSATIEWNPDSKGYRDAKITFTNDADRYVVFYTTNSKAAFSEGFTVSSYFTTGESYEGYNGNASTFLGRAITFGLLASEAHLYVSSASEGLVGDLLKMGIMNPSYKLPIIPCGMYLYGTHGSLELYGTPYNAVNELKTKLVLAGYMDYYKDIVNTALANEPSLNSSDYLFSNIVNLKSPSGYQDWVTFIFLYSMYQENHTFPWVVDFTPSVQEHSMYRYNYLDYFPMITASDYTELEFNIRFKVGTPENSGSYVYLHILSYNCMLPLNLSADAMSYLAENIATITNSSTIVFSKKSIENAGGIDGAVIQSIIDKGWTVKEMD